MVAITTEALSYRLKLSATDTWLHLSSPLPRLLNLVACQEVSSKFGPLMCKEPQ